MAFVILLIICYLISLIYIISHQYPLLAVLDEDINIGDELRLTAMSKTGAFNSVTETVTIGDDQRAEVTFDIVGKGGISASFEMTENPAVIAMLYGSNGELIRKQTYTEAKTQFTELEDGEYTLISMGQSDMMNSILRLSNFDEIGLSEGKDYVKNEVSVECGMIADVKISEVPAFDESLFYYTSSTTVFSANKSSITTGNYLTLRENVDFKSVYKNGIDNVTLIVDLPKNTNFVEQSVIQGPNLLPYTIDNNRLTIPLGDSYQSQTRFCVMPTSGGSFNATASIVFDYDGKTITQPVGTANVEIKDIEIVVPSITAAPGFKVSGTALGKSTIKIIENGVILGSGIANATGLWSVECELVNPYNMSKHSIYAEITTPSGVIMDSEIKTISYDVNALQVSKVTMYHWNPEMHKTYQSVFDFLNPKTSSTQWTVYYPKKIFTYTIEFTDNDPERISNVVLYVHTADGKFVPVNASFDKDKEMWCAEIDMGRSSNGYYPVNCSVNFDYVITEQKIDQRQINDVWDNDSRFMSDYTRLLNDLNNITGSSEILSEEQWVEFYAQHGLTYDESEEDIIFPENYDSLSEEEKIAFCQAIADEMASEMESLKDSIALYMPMFSMDTDAGSLEFGDGSGLKVKTCEGINAEMLLEQGFTQSECMDGSFVYTYISQEKSIFVDFSKDIWVETSRSYLLTLGLGDEFLAYMRRINNIIQKWDDSNIGQCINVLHEIRGIFENANIKLSNLISDLKVDLYFAADKWYSSLYHQESRYKGLIRKAPNSAMAYVYREKLSEVMAKKAIVKGYKACIMPACKLLLKSIPIVDWIVITADLIDKALDIKDIYTLIDRKKCLTDYERQDFINQNRILLARVGAYAAGSIIPTAIGDTEIFVGVLGTMETGGVSLGVSVMGFAVKSVSQILVLLLDNMLSQDIENLKEQIRSIKCPDDDNDDNGGDHRTGGSHQSGSPNDAVQIDPSGYVYEAVPSNRVEGVQATIYYKETKEDMYGDPYEEINLWNAEEYAQQNPLFTDENGMYRWDVPQGLWQVKFEKDGYQTAYSEWLPVPPPQLDVNIAITQNKQPEVTEARAYEEGVEVQFDKFMDPSTLNIDNIYVTANGEKLSGEIMLIDSEIADEYASEDDGDVLRYASRARFVPAQKLSATTGEIRLTVSRNVLSYAGIPMTETFSQVLDVEKEVQTIVADDVKVLYGGEKEVTIFALPYEASVGRTLHIANSSDLIVSVDATDVNLDEEGKAVVKIKGELPGQAMLTFTIDDVTATGECAIDVVTEIITAEGLRNHHVPAAPLYIAVRRLN